MGIIKENTVSAEGQMDNASLISFLGDENAKTRILVVGNSITRHGPKADIGWERDWGMAASAPERDFVHRLYTKIKESGKDVFMRISQCADWEVNIADGNYFLIKKADKDFGADVIVFRLGENVSEENKPLFKTEAEKFIAYLKGENVKMIFTTCFWKNEIVDDSIRELAEEYNSPLVELGDLGDDSEMRATGQFEHTGVAAHPSDKGMENIAERIYKVLVKEL